METRYYYILRIILACSDLLLVNLTFFLGIYLTNKHGVVLSANFYQSNTITCSLIWIICTGIFGLYSECTVHKLESIYRATWRTIVLHMFLFVAYLFLADHTDFPKHILISFYIVMVLGFVLSRFIGTALQAGISKNYDMRKAVAVLGVSEGGLKLAAYLEKQNSLNFVGFLGEDNSGSNTPVLLSPSAQLKKAAELGVEEVFICVTPDKMGDMTDLIKEGEKQCMRLKFVPDLSALETNFRYDKMGNFTVLCARKEPLQSIENRFKKRLFDIVVSLFVIVFIFSWLYPLLAIIIKLQSRGPVFFAQLRTGRDNKPFWCYKFRSMRVNNDSDKRQASKGDDRITPIGRFMRKTSLDEFPQFFNVLLGYMSVIGPRPHMLAHTEEYRKIIDKYMVRQFLKPGISGWAQTNGFRGETKELILMEKRVEHDIWYFENWSLMLDVKVIFLTVINILKREENAY